MNEILIDEIGVVQHDNDFELNEHDQKSWIEINSLYVTQEFRNFEPFIYNNEDKERLLLNNRNKGIVCVYLRNNFVYQFRQVLETLVENILLPSFFIKLLSKLSIDLTNKQKLNLILEGLCDVTIFNRLGLHQDHFVKMYQCLIEDSYTTNFDDYLHLVQNYRTIFVQLATNLRNKIFQFNTNNTLNTLYGEITDKKFVKSELLKLNILVNQKFKKYIQKILQTFPYLPNRFSFYNYRILKIYDKFYTILTQQSFDNIDNFSDTLQITQNQIQEINEYLHEQLTWGFEDELIGNIDFGIRLIDNYIASTEQCFGINSPKDIEQTSAHGPDII